SEDERQRAEALYRVGICHYNMNNFDKAFVSLRKVTNDYPWTVYANEAFYYIGQCHVKLGRWAKAIEALKMVGTSVPTNVKGGTFSEAGQRLYVKIFDKDLVVLMASEEKLKLTLNTKSGDKEEIVAEPLGRSGAYYIGSIMTILGNPAPGDGKLQIIGGDVATVSYTDKNTKSGKRNQKIATTVRMVSSAVAGFTDGAYREYTKGVFGDSACFMRVKDLDRDLTDKKDNVTVKVCTQYK
ncbi:unnamed protein product, partial [marine sediment metagenome]